MNVTTAVAQAVQPASSGSAALSSDQGFGAVLEEQISTAGEGQSQSESAGAQGGDSQDASSLEVPSELADREQVTTADVAAVIGNWLVATREVLRVPDATPSSGLAVAGANDGQGAPAGAAVSAEQGVMVVGAQALASVHASAVAQQAVDSGVPLAAAQPIAVTDAAASPAATADTVASGSSAAVAPASAGTEQTASEAVSGDVLARSAPRAESPSVAQEPGLVLDEQSGVAKPAAQRSDSAPLPVGVHLDSTPPLAAAVAAPALTALQAPAAAAPVAPAPGPASAPQSLPDQIAPQIASLKSLGDGQHTLTLRVTPESLGPVRVIAHITGETMRIELLGASEQARDALRSALSDLRRDLAATTTNATLDLGSQGRGGRQHSDNAHSSQAPVDAFEQNPSILQQPAQTVANQTRPAPNRSTGVDLYV